MAYDRQRIAGYYDGFANYQSKVGINERHATIMRLLRENGLQRHHAVLEVGCGVGQITGLVARYCKQGSVVGVDISEENVRRAADHLRALTNVDLICSDMTTDVFEAKFDFVIFPDVLEHIPLELHPAVLGNAARALKPGGKVFIHIPHPLYQDYLRAHEPDKMQIVDQPLSAADLLSAAEATGLRLVCFQSYALFRQPADYQYIVMDKPDGAYRPMLRPYLQRVWQRLRLVGLRR